MSPTSVRSRSTWGGLAQSEGLKNYEVVIDGEIYLREVTPEYVAEFHPEWLEPKKEESK